MTAHLSEYEAHMRRTTVYLEERLQVSHTVANRHSTFSVVVVVYFPFQATFKDKIRFNSRFPGSDVLPNTCNVSILGPTLQGDVTGTLSSLGRS